LLISAVSAWDLSIKVGLGKLILSSPFRDWIERVNADLGLITLPITVECADIQRSLPFHHRDPFDRMVIAQSIVEQVPIVSGDEIFDQYPVKRVW